MLSVSDCVNRIQKCFGKCKFLLITGALVRVQIGPRVYDVEFHRTFEVMEARLLPGCYAWESQRTNFAEWHEAVLNGLERLESGEMVARDLQTVIQGAV